jgi:hypothetical protein
MLNVNKKCVFQTLLICLGKCGSDNKFSNHFPQFWAWLGDCSPGMPDSGLRFCELASFRINQADECHKKSLSRERKSNTTLDGNTEVSWVDMLYIIPTTHGN